MLTAAVFGPAVVALVWWGATPWVAAVVAIVLLVALREFFAMGAKAGLHGYATWTILCALGIVFMQWKSTPFPGWATPDGINLIASASQPPLEFVFILFTLGAAILALANRGGVTAALPACAISSAGLLLVALPFSYLVRLHGAWRVGPKLLLFTLAIVWAGDSLAYFAGRALGKHPLAPALSPKKTWEGASGNLLGASLAAGGFWWWMKIPFLDLLAPALLASAAGQVGDLLESGYKRGAGVKDSGTLLPGHGGILDRIDALIFAAPVVWYYFYFAGRIR